MTTDLFSKQLANGQNIVIRISTTEWPENMYIADVMIFNEDGKLRALKPAGSLDHAIDIYNNYIQNNH